MIVSLLFLLDIKYLMLYLLVRDKRLDEEILQDAFSFSHLRIIKKTLKIF